MLVFVSNKTDIVSRLSLSDDSNCVQGNEIEEAAQQEKVSSRPPWNIYFAMFFVSNID